MNEGNKQTEEQGNNNIIDENSIDIVIKNLHSQGLTIIESIKVLRSEHGLSLSEAKKFVSEHPVWTTVTKAAEPLHDDLIKIWKNAEKNNP